MSYNKLARMLNLIFSNRLSKDDATMRIEIKFDHLNSRLDRIILLLEDMIENDSKNRGW